MHQLPLKITNVNNDVSRLILQTYIIALFLGLKVFDIYTIVQNFVHLNPLITNTSISPATIYLNNKPTPSIQKILDPIINKLYLNEEDIIIRTNWCKMCYPPISIDKLIKYIDETKK